MDSFTNIRIGSNPKKLDTGNKLKVVGTRAGECSLDDDDDDDDGDGDARWEVSLVFSRQRRRSLDVNGDDDGDGEMENLGPLLKIQSCCRRILSPFTCHPRVRATSPATSVQTQPPPTRPILPPPGACLGTRREYQIGVWKWTPEQN